jgi:hypothetical protein
MAVRKFLLVFLGQVEERVEGVVVKIANPPVVASLLATLQIFPRTLGRLSSGPRVCWGL